jgi:hypothetical protein
MDNKLGSNIIDEFGSESRRNVDETLMAWHLELTSPRNGNEKLAYWSLALGLRVAGVDVGRSKFGGSFALNLIALVESCPAEANRVVGVFASRSAPGAAVERNETVLQQPDITPAKASPANASRTGSRAEYSAENSLESLETRVEQALMVGWLLYDARRARTYVKS